MGSCTTRPDYRTFSKATYTLLTDGTRTIEVHLVRDSPHTDGMVMAYLSKEKLLVEADIFDMPGPGVPAVTEGPGTAANLVDNIEKLKLDVQRLLPIHAADIVPAAERLCT